MWLQLGSSAKMSVKANCFHSFARVIGEPTRLTKQPDQVPAENAGVWSMCERLFNSLGAECSQQPTMVLLMTALKQPFEELRTAVFHVLRSVAAQNNPWGMRTLLSYGGFFEFLMDRTTELTKETREWKFAVLDAVLASPFQSQIGTCAVLLALCFAMMKRQDLHRLMTCAFVLLLSPRRCIIAGEAAGQFASRTLRWSCCTGRNGAGVGVIGVSQSEMALAAWIAFVFRVKFDQPRTSSSDC
ncbi:unnamed protein product [Phytophthora lilii]|uniref:Unnamed protein product n=1 Tax=Phytophthora lilii TaxID=2077276 RepID=A0A9W6TKK1_9STRA|nr:unnamed protein product [Phytophthora lilii]